MIQVKRVFVDKTMAELFLSMELQPSKGVRDTNRKFSEVVVNNYAFEMLAGRWRETPQGLAFKGFLKDNTAQYVDGGQRARAIIQAATKGARIADVEFAPDPDIGFYFLVFEGLTQQEVDVLDRGKHRNTADIIQMAGYVNKNVLTSVARLCWLYENVAWSPEAWRKYPISPATIKQYLEDNPGLEDAIAEGAHVKKHMIVSAASAGYHEAVKAKVDRDDLDDFMDHLASGANMDADNPILALREMLKRTVRKKRRWTREEQLALFIKAFLKWSNGEKTRAVSFKVGGAAPEAFPRFD
jgi:hypothetical protein